MYVSSDNDHVRQLEQDARRLIVPRKSHAMLPAYYEELRQKYPRAFELQQQTWSSRKTQYHAGDTVASECDGGSVAAHASDKNELNQIITLLAESLTTRQHHGRMADVPQTSRVQQMTPLADDLRTRLQRNKETMQKLLTERSPFRSHASHSVKVELSGTSTNLADDSRRGVTSDTIPSADARLDKRHKSEHTLSADWVQQPHVAAATPIIDDGSMVMLSKHGHLSKHAERDTVTVNEMIVNSNTNEHSQPGKKSASISMDTASVDDWSASFNASILKSKARECIGYSLGAASTHNGCRMPANDKVIEFPVTTDMRIANIDLLGPAPKLKKSLSARESLTSEGDGGTSSDSRSRGQSILRSADSFGGSISSKSGRVRFSEMPDEIDESAPRLAQLKWLSETSIFDATPEDNGKSNEPQAGQPRSGSRRRSRRPSELRETTLDTPSIPPKPPRLLHLQTIDGMSVVSQPVNLEEGQSGAQHFKELRNIDTCNNHMPCLTSEEHGSEKWEHSDCTASDYSAPSETGGLPTGLQKPSANSALSHEDFVQHPVPGGSDLMLSLPVLDGPKAKSSRRTKLAASDFEYPYKTATTGSSAVLATRSHSGPVSSVVSTAVSSTANDSSSRSGTSATVECQTAKHRVPLTDLEHRLQPSVRIGSSKKKSLSSAVNGGTFDIPGSVSDEMDASSPAQLSTEDGFISPVSDEIEGLADDNGSSNTLPVKPAAPIYDLEDAAETNGANEIEASSSAGVSEFGPKEESKALRRDHLSSSQLSLAERMGSLRRAARGAIQTLRRAMSLERLSGNSRARDEDAKFSALSTPKPGFVSSLPENVPKVKKSLSLRSFGKLTFKKRASYDLASANETPVTGRTGAMPLRASGGALAVQYQQTMRATSLSTPEIDANVDKPTNFRAIGRLLELRDDGTRLVQLLRPPHGPFGFYVTKANGRLKNGVYVSRMSDSYPDKFFAGLLGLGDELLEVNGRPVEQLTLDDIYDAMASTIDSLLLRVKPLTLQQGHEMRHTTC